MIAALSRLSRVASLCGMFAAVATTAGCVIEIDEPLVDPLFVSDMADMEVRWTINRSTDPLWCDDLGIETWQLEVSGPDARHVYIDCRGEYWTSGSRLYGLREGDYRVRLTALDFDDLPIAAAGARVNDIYDDGGVDVIAVHLDDRDF